MAGLKVTKKMKVKTETTTAKIHPTERSHLTKKMRKQTVLALKMKKTENLIFNLQHSASIK